MHFGLIANYYHRMATTLAAENGLGWVARDRPLIELYQVIEALLPDKSDYSNRDQRRFFSAYYPIFRKQVDASERPATLLAFLTFLAKTAQKRHVAQEFSERVDAADEDGAVHHPGKELARLIRETQVTQDQVAVQLGTSRYSVNQIVNGHRNISAEMALKLARVFGTSAEDWMTLQVTWDLHKAREKEPA